MHGGLKRPHIDRSVLDRLVVGDCWRRLGLNGAETGLDPPDRTLYCNEKRIGAVKSSRDCGMLAGKGGSGSARMIMAVTST